MKKKLIVILNLIVFIGLISIGIFHYLNQEETVYLLLDYTPPEKWGNLHILPVKDLQKESAHFENDSDAYWSMRQSHINYLKFAQETIDGQEATLNAVRKHSGKASEKNIRDIIYQCECALQTQSTLVIVRKRRIKNLENIIDSIYVTWPDSLFRIDDTKIEYYSLD